MLSNAKGARSGATNASCENHPNFPGSVAIVGLTER